MQTRQALRVVRDMRAPVLGLFTAVGKRLVAEGLKYRFYEMSRRTNVLYSFSANGAILYLPAGGMYLAPPALPHWKPGATPQGLRPKLLTSAESAIHLRVFFGDPSPSEFDVEYGVLGSRRMDCIARWELGKHLGGVRINVGLSESHPLIRPLRSGDLNYRQRKPQPQLVPQINFHMMQSVLLELNAAEIMNVRGVAFHLL
jgi:hypothetical protein